MGLAGEASAGVGAVEKVDGEGDFAVGLEVPAGAVEVLGVSVGQGDAFPAEAGALPADACGVEGEDGVKASKEEDAGGRCGKDLSDGPERQVEAAVGGLGIDEVSVASRDG